MKLLAYLSFGILLFSCDKNDQNTIEVPPCTTTHFSYYSDYFVFLADDGGSPLVIPMDVNWSPTEMGYNSEFKAWYGTTNNWPIGYALKDTIVSSCDVPKEAWAHANGPYFQFEPENRTLVSTIWGAPTLKLRIPEAEEWVKTPAVTDKAIYGCRTNATVDGASRSGWLIYERIRWDNTTNTSFGDFAAFYWIPLVIDGKLFHFEQHQGEQTASLWQSNNGVVTVSTLPAFSLSITAESTDQTSGRTNIPDTIHLLAPDWNIDHAFASTGHQTGYGPEFPNGLAYYRQSLLESTTANSTAYGMLELILEDD